MQVKCKPNAPDPNIYMSNMYILKQRLIHGLAGAVAFAISPGSHIRRWTFVQLISGPEKEKTCKLNPQASPLYPGRPLMANGNSSVNSTWGATDPQHSRSSTGPVLWPFAFTKSKVQRFHLKATAQGYTVIRNESLICFALLLSRRHRTHGCTSPSKDRPFL